KCSKEAPSCSSCVQSGSSCHYSGRVVRSPLTRAYLTSVENRMHSLEKLVLQLLPGIDIDAALKSPDLPQLSPCVIASETTDAPQLTPTAPLREHNSAVEQDPVLPEAVPINADGFNWEEEHIKIDGLSDGMAALSVEPAGVGYLGPTSGVVFLRSLLDWASLLHQSRPPDHEHKDDSTHQPKSILSSSYIANGVLSKQIASTFIDAYFRDYHVCYPFVHEGIFRAQYHEIIARPPKRSWDMLYHTIIAVGAWSLSHDQDGLEEYLYRRALTLGQHQSVLEVANLATVQAHVLLSNLSQKRNSPNTGWNLLGLAVRTSLSIALHRELPHWNISLMEREIRRRVWWGLYIFDSGASTTFGRAIMLPDQDSMNVHLVLNIEDEVLTPETSELPPESAQPTVYSSLKAQSEFHLHTNSISNRLLADPGLSAEAALAINASIDAWILTLPPYFQLTHDPSCQMRWYLFARARLWWRIWNLKIIVFRHILLRRAVAERSFSSGQIPHSSHEQCKRFCVEAAHSTIVSIHNYSTQNLTRLEGWYATYFLFHAALVIILCILSFPNEPDLQTWHEGVRLARTTLREHLGQDSLSTRCVAIIDQLVSDNSTVDDMFRDVILDQEALSTFPWSIESNELFSSFDRDFQNDNI
ncbi:hypothetical protein DM02DRAFT_538639, partial [Periconia macrospinosa]